MTTSVSSRNDALLIEAAAAAVRYLAQHGYETTTAGELADAIGMSRSTFFRRFGSKEDVVFADHDLARTRLEAVLGNQSLSPLEAVTRAPIEVLHSLVRDRETARLRWELLRQNPSLRERELVLTHRYERDFAGYLETAAVPGTPRWVPVALAAGLVAVHNAALRRWLHDDDARALSALERELRELAERFAPWLGGEQHVSRVVVAAFDAQTTPEQVLQAIAEQLA